MKAAKYKVLFVCIHNSARSQMAEAFLNLLGKGVFQAESAGIEPGILNPYVVAVMAENQIDIRLNKTKSVFELLQKKERYQAVITVCDAASAQKCPVFPGAVRRIAWSFEDPSAFDGTEEEKIQLTRKVRDEIRQQVIQFIEQEISEV